MVSSIFTIEGSLVSLNTSADVPNFYRPSPVNLERYISGSLELYPVQSYFPAISSEDGSFLLEPPTANLVTYNMDLGADVWLKGSNVTVRTDYAGLGAAAPDGTQTADRLRWDTGVGNSQYLQRTFRLEAGQKYTMSFILRLRGGVFGTNDTIQLLSGVDSNVIIPLASLNKFTNRYVLVSKTFQASGRQPILPGTHHQTVNNFQITNVTTNTATIVIPNGLTTAAGDLVGGLFRVNNSAYLITANTGVDNANSIVVTMATGTLISDGVTTAMKAILDQAPEQLVTVALYSESTASVDWGGMQLEQHPFRTSMIYQDDMVEIRAGAILYYRTSPISGMKTFGFFADLKETRGDGNLFNFGNLVAEIVNGRLKVTAGSTVFIQTTPLPAAPKIYIQVLEANSSLAIYVNGVLATRATLNNFRAQTDVPFILTSDGVRTWQRMMVLDTPLLEGQVNIGDTAKQEVLALFQDPVPVDAVAISAHAPLINLPPVTIPAPTPPVLSTGISAVDTAAAKVTVSSSTGLFIGATVNVRRGDYLVIRTTVTAISNTVPSAPVITLAAAYGVAIGDTLLFGESTLPGYASVRFPYDPIDPQIVQAIDVANKKLKVAATLSFLKSKAFVRTPYYQDSAEVNVTDLDSVGNYLTVNDVTGINVGDTIAQPRFLSELEIIPACYVAGLIDPVDGVFIAEKEGRWSNGVKLENWNNFPVTVNPYVRPYL